MEYEAAGAAWLATCDVRLVLCDELLQPVSASNGIEMPVMPSSRHQHALLDVSSSSSDQDPGPSELLPPPRDGNDNGHADDDDGVNLIEEVGVQQDRMSAELVVKIGSFVR